MSAPSSESLPLIARFRVAVLVAELARLAVRELEVRTELEALVAAPGCAEAAAALAHFLLRLSSKGER
jgi:hypothetical protein